MHIYFLQVMSCLDNEEHYENVYCTRARAIKEGKIWVDKLLRKQYKDWFEENEINKIPELTTEQLFKLKAVYDFSVTEFDPEEYEKSHDIKNVPVIENYDIYDSYCADLTPVKVIHSYDFNGNEIYIAGVYVFNYKGTRKERKVMMKYEDYINPQAGTKFKKGDIVKIKENYDSHFGDYHFYDKLHVITEIPHKKKGQKFFTNSYDVIVNHNSFDEGCHVDVFNEKELELYTGKLPEDSPLIFLSKYFKGEIELKNVSWMDIECGKVILNENKSFRDIPEIMEQMKGE